MKNLLIQKLFLKIGKEVFLAPAESKDEVQKDARNEPDLYITKWWKPKTSLYDGISKVFELIIKIERIRIHDMFYIK